MVDLEKLGERQIVIDCDVLQADGGTRTASITGACVAVADALNGLVARGLLAASPMNDFVAAVSVGMYQGVPVLDLDYPEDSDCETDMNVVMTGSGGFVEVQGTAEASRFTAMSWTACWCSRRMESPIWFACSVKRCRAEAASNHRCPMINSFSPATMPRRPPSCPRCWRRSASK